MTAAKPQRWWPGINHQHPLARGLVGCWPFWEGGGNKLYDISGKGNHGTLTGMDPVTDWVATPYGGGVNFDGTDDHVQLDKWSMFADPTQLTWCMWVKKTVHTGHRALWSVAAGNYANAEHWGVAWMSGDAIRLHSGQGGGSILLPYSLLGRWMQIVVCLTSATTWSLYIDGRYIGDSTWRKYFDATGARIIGEYGGYFPGDIASLTIHDRALTAAEIAELYADPWAFMRPRRSARYFVAGGTVYSFSLSESMAYSLAYARVVTNLRSITETSAFLAGYEKTTFTPAAVGTTDNWALGAGADKPTACQTKDGDTSYIHANVANVQQLFTFTNTIPANHGIFGVRVNVNIEHTGVNFQFKGLVRENATTSGASTDTDSTASYADYNGTTLYQRPSDSGAWTWSDIDSLEFGVEILGGAGGGDPSLRCSQVEVEVWHGAKVSRIADYLRVISETTAITDSPQRTVSAARIISESIAMSDSVSRTVGILRTISETLIAADGVTRNVTANRLITDSLAASDAVQRTAAITRLITDSLAATEIIKRKAQNLRVITDTLEITDAVQRVVTALRSISETLATSDAAERTASFIRLITATLGVSEDVQRVVHAVRTIAETLGISDALAAEIVAAVLAPASWCSARVSIVRYSTADVPFNLISRARTSFVRHVNANVPVS